MRELVARSVHFTSVYTHYTIILYIIETVTNLLYLYSHPLTERFTRFDSFYTTWMHACYCGITERQVYQSVWSIYIDNSATLFKKMIP